QFGTQSSENLITEDRFIDEIPGIVFYTRKKEGDSLEDVRLYTLENGEVTKRLSAKSGKIKFDKTAQKISFELFDGVSEIKIPPKKPEPSPHAVNRDEGAIIKIPPPEPSP